MPALSLDNSCLGKYAPAVTRAKRHPRPSEARQWPLVDNVGYLITRTKALLWECADAAMARHNVTLAQWIVMNAVHNKPDVTVGEICAEIKYDRGAMTRMVDRLARKGLIRRIRRPGDRRAVHLALTPAGRTLYPKLLATSRETLDAAFAAFSPAEMRTFHAVLRRFVEARHDR